MPLVFFHVVCGFSIAAKKKKGDHNQENQAKLAKGLKDEGSRTKK